MMFFTQLKVSFIDDPHTAYKYIWAIRWRVSTLMAQIYFICKGLTEVKFMRMYLATSP